MAKKRRTKLEEQYLSHVASLGCYACREHGLRDVEAEIHHKTGAGMGLKASDYESMPLCHPHHRTGGYGVAVHAGVAAWEAKYGTQDEMVERVQAEVLEIYGFEIPKSF